MLAGNSLNSFLISRSEENSTLVVYGYNTDMPLFDADGALQPGHDLIPNIRDSKVDWHLPSDLSYLCMCCMYLQHQPNKEFRLDHRFSAGQMYYMINFKFVSYQYLKFREGSSPPRLGSSWEFWETWTRLVVIN